MQPIEAAAGEARRRCGDARRPARAGRRRQRDESPRARLRISRMPATKWCWRPAAAKRSLSMREALGQSRAVRPRAGRFPDARDGRRDARRADQCRSAALACARGAADLDGQHRRGEPLRVDGLRGLSVEAGACARAARRASTRCSRTSRTSGMRRRIPSSRPTAMHEEAAARALRGQGAAGRGQRREPEGRRGSSSSASAAT